MFVCVLCVQRLSECWLTAIWSRSYPDLGLLVHVFAFCLRRQYPATDNKTANLSKLRAQIRVACENSRPETRPNASGSMINADCARVNVSNIVTHTISREMALM